MHICWRLYCSVPSIIIETSGDQFMEDMALRQASEKWRVIARWVNRQDTDRCNFGVVRVEIIGLIPNDAIGSADKNRK